MVDLKIIEKLLLVLANPISRKNINTVFELYEKDPLKMYVEAMERFQESWNKDTTGQNNIFICFVAGVMMAELSTREDLKQRIFVEPTDTLQAQIGENVIDLQSKRLEKR